MTYGDVEVTNQVAGFVRRLVATGEIVGEEPLPMPPVTLATKAVWWALAGTAPRPRRVSGRASSPARSTPPSTPRSGSCRSSRRAIAGTSGASRRRCTRTPGLTTIFVYDGYPGGAGITERGFADAERWLGATFDRVRECPCRDGCPSCVVSPKCGNGNEPLDKRAAASLLAAILGRAWG